MAPFRFCQLSLKLPPLIPHNFRDSLVGSPNFGEGLTILVKIDYGGTVVDINF